MNDELKLPPYVYGRECGENEKVYTEAAMREAIKELLEALQTLTDYAERNGALVGWARAAIAKHGGQHD